MTTHHLSTSRGQSRLGLSNNNSASSLRYANHTIDTEDEDSDAYYSDDELQGGVLNQPRPSTGGNNNTAAADDETPKTGTATAPGGQTEEEIANEYNKQKSKTRKPIPTLTPEHLVGDKGLMVVRQSFPSRFGSSSAFRASNKKKNQRPKFTKQDMPRFTKNLVQAYQNWTDDLVPGVPLEELVVKLYSLSGKAGVKSHLQTLRNQVRNHHVERIYGLEKGEALLRQLEEGLMQEEQDPEEDPEEYPNNEEEGNDVKNELNTVTLGEDTSSPQENATSTTTEEEAQDVPTNTTEGRGEPVTPTSVNDEEAGSSSSTANASSPDVLPTPRRITNLRKRALEDSDDDEEELVFESAPSSSISNKRRVVLEDSEDEDDEDEEHKEETNKSIHSDSVVVEDEEASSTQDKEDDDANKEPKDLPENEAAEEVLQSVEDDNQGDGDIDIGDVVAGEEDNSVEDKPNARDECKDDAEGEDTEMVAENVSGGEEGSTENPVAAMDVVDEVGEQKDVALSPANANEEPTTNHHSEDI